MQSKSFIVYKSSAGSGKTYTLVKEYLKLVLSNPLRVRQILAITFTNAASAEMKDRIIKALSEIAALKKDSFDTSSYDTSSAKELVKQLVAETSLDENTILENSEKVLFYILHNYNDFSISTIDSFTHRILRTFAFDLQIPINFEIEFDTQQVIEKAADILVSRAGEGDNKELTNLLVQFIESRIDEERSFGIEREIVQMATKMLNEESIHYIDKLKDKSIDDFIKLYNIIKTKTEEFRENVSNSARDALDKIAKSGIQISSLAYGNKGIYSWFNKVGDGKLPDCYPLSANVSKTLNENKWHSAKAKEANDIEAINDLAPHLQSLAEEILTLFEKGHGKYIILENIRNKLFSLALINEMEKTIDDIRREENILFISDFNKKIMEVSAHEPVPFIYERIGEKYQNFMIDEFQDTSVLQWQNMLPLVDNSLAGGNMSLLVGDAKQSIYRWRGGDAQQFIKLPKLTDKIFSVNKEQVEKTLIAQYKQIPENPEEGTINFRSKKNIVEFNNNFFETIKKLLPDSINEVYRGHHQKNRESKTGGYVEISFIEETRGDRAGLREETVNKTENIINKLIAGNYSYRDIAILCRKKSEAAAIAQHLTQQGMYVVSEESLLLSSSPKINFLISFLRLLNDPGNNVAITETVNYMVSSGIINQSGDLHHYLKELFVNEKDDNDVSEKSFDRFIKLLKKNNIVLPGSLFSSTTIYALLEELSRLFFSSQEKIDPYLVFFFDCVYEYQQKEQGTLTGFLKYWDENLTKFSLVVPDKLNAVKVITIHKSKGLQFPVVIYPFANETVRWHGDDGFWIDVGDDVPGIDAAYIGAKKELEKTPLADMYKEEEENRLLDMINLTYVAFTRPQDKLYVISSKPASGNFPKNSLNGILYEYLKSKGSWNNEQITYSFPDNASDDTTNKEVKESYDFENENSWLNYHINRLWGDKITSRLLNEHYEPGEATKRITRGKAIHKAMENISETKDLPFIMKQMVMDGYIAKDEKDNLEKNIENLIENPLIKPFFSPNYQVKTEPGIFDSKGNFYRPDRVAFSEEQTAVIDYKTGQQDEKHKVQIRRYGNLLKDMGYQNLKLIVAYIDLGIVEEVGFE